MFRENTIPDSKTTLLLHLASAMAPVCSPCMEFYLGEAEKEGITAEESGAVQAVVMAVSAGRVNAQLREVERRSTRITEKILMNFSGRFRT